MRRCAHVVNAALLALLVGGSLWVYPFLPARIPRHFGIVAPTLVMFGALQYGTYHVATTDATALPALVTAVTVGALVALFGLVALLVWRTRVWIEERAGER
jgi:hypothetical protein